MNYQNNYSINGAVKLASQLAVGNINTDAGIPSNSNTPYYFSGDISAGGVLDRVLGDYLRYAVLNCPEKLGDTAFRNVGAEHYFTAAGAEIIARPESAMTFLENLSRSPIWNNTLCCALIELSVEAGNYAAAEFCCRRRDKGSVYIPDYYQIISLIRKSRGDNIIPGIIPMLTADLSEKTLPDFERLSQNSGGMCFDVPDSYEEGAMADIECIYRYLEYIYGTLYPDESVRSRICKTINEVYLASDSPCMHSSSERFFTVEVPALIKLGIKAENLSAAASLFHNYTIFTPKNKVKKSLRILSSACADEPYFCISSWRMLSNERIDEFLSALSEVIDMKKAALVIDSRSYMCVSKAALRKAMGIFGKAEWRLKLRDGADISEYRALTDEYFSFFSLLLKKGAFTPGQMSELLSCAVENRNARVIRELSPYIDSIPITAN